MNKYSITAAITAILLSASACSSSSDKKADAVEPQSDVDPDAIIEAVQNHDRKQLSQAIDEMALNADDLSPKQAVSVLMGYYELQSQYASEHRTKQSMETMRNFVDVYDIVSSNHGADFKRALESTKQYFPDVDFTAIYLQYADKLSGYEGGGVYTEPTESVADSTHTATIDSVAENQSSDQLPPELRPAE